jgi:tryptophan synthase alpha chain
MKKMNRLTTTIKKAKATGKKLFCAYVTLGYPYIGFSEKLIEQFEKIGVDIVELGFPFSDPLADGPIIQEASYESLKNKTTMHDAFRVVTSLRKKGVTLPIVFFSYYNPMFHYGTKRFVDALVEHGFDGIICPDLPPEEDPAFVKAARKNNISFIYLITPTTSASRMKLLAEKSSDFIYYVSRKGVTGTHNTLAADLKSNLARLRRETTKSILVGFGVSNKEHIRTLVRLSDGVIVGSAIVQKIKETRDVKKVAQFVHGLVNAVKY